MQDDISGWSDWNQNFEGIEEISSPSELHGEDGEHQTFTAVNPVAHSHHKGGAIPADS